MHRFLESAALDISLKNPEVFRNVIRPALYERYKDPESVHESAIEIAKKYEDVFAKNRIDYQDLYVNIKNNRMMPFGTAAGLDKNGDMLKPVSHVVGFMTAGTVVVEKRIGNNRPRVCVDDENENMYNAQGFPSEGIDYFLEKIKEYRQQEYKTPVIISICGLPKKNAEYSLEEMEILLKELTQYADGIEWNPFSPNTASLQKLRTKEMFAKHARIISKYTNILKLVKIGPYEEGQEKETLELVDAWLSGGGDGVTAVNTLKVARHRVPNSEWGYESAGMSGRVLKSYRMRAIKDIRKEFPQSIIFAAGGIHDGDDAYETLKVADAVEGYTPFAYYGFGKENEIMERVLERLHEDGLENLQQLHDSR